MPYNSSGVFVNVAGATSAATGQIIQSTVWNNIHADYSLALNEVMQQLISMPGNRNVIWMNGGLEVWQRGAGATASIAVAASTTIYTADRWYVVTDVNQASVVSAQAGLIDESRLCARVQRNSGQTGTVAMRFAYPLDTDEVFRCRGNFVTLSFRARAGSNWSPTSGTLSFALFSGTGAAPAKRSGTPYTGEVTVLSGAVNLSAGGATVATVLTGSVVVPANSTQLELQFFWTPVGTASTNDYFEIDDVQIETNLSINDYVPTAFDRLPFAEMLQGCKVHYQKNFAYDTAPAYGVSSNELLSYMGAAANISLFTWQFCPSLRSSASLTLYSPSTATSSLASNLTDTSVTVTGIPGINQARFRSAVAVTNGVTFTINAEASAGI